MEQEHKREITEIQEQEKQSKSLAHVELEAKKKQNMEQYERLFKEGPQRAAAEIGATGDPLAIRAFLDFVWKSLAKSQGSILATQDEEKKDQIEAVLAQWRGQQFCEWCNWFVCCGRDPKESKIPPLVYLKMVKEAHPSSSACGATWGDGQMIVSCKVTSVIGLLLTENETRTVEWILRGLKR